MIKPYRLFCTASFFLSGIGLLFLVGCSASREASDTETRPFLTVKVEFVNGSPVQGAAVRTDPPWVLGQTDARGVYNYYGSLERNNYSFIATHKDYPDTEGITRVEIAESIDYVQDTIRVQLGNTERIITIISVLPDTSEGGVGPGVIGGVRPNNN